MKKLSLGLALAFLMLATLAYAQSGNPTDNPTVASSVVSNLKSLSPGGAGNGEPLSFSAGYCLYTGIYNQFTLQCIDPGISAQSSVFASISQTNSSGRRILGNPRPSIANIVPYNGGVYVNVNAGTGNPIDVRLDILIAP
ncbi:MAG: hypothetical protein WCC87_18050 [Candidatus Korobacteraceae bacterium]